MTTLLEMNGVPVRTLALTAAAWLCCCTTSGARRLATLCYRGCTFGVLLVCLYVTRRPLVRDLKA